MVQVGDSSRDVCLALERASLANIARCQYDVHAPQDLALEWAAAPGHAKRTAQACGKLGAPAWPWLPGGICMHMLNKVD
jgi:hypothetical protein